MYAFHGIPAGVDAEFSQDGNKYYGTPRDGKSCWIPTEMRSIRPTACRLVLRLQRDKASVNQRLSNSKHYHDNNNPASSYIYRN